MQKHRGFILGLALSALVGLMGNQAHATSITLTVDLNGIVIFTATSSSPDQSVEASLVAVNTALGAHGSAYKFTGLSAQSNYTGTSLGSLQTTFQLNTSGAGTTAAVLSIDTTQSGFLSPTGPGGSVVSTAGGSYNTASGSLSYTSDYQRRTRQPWFSPWRTRTPTQVPRGRSPSGQSRRATSCRTTS
jgi:hypothetical protein